MQRNNKCEHCGDMFQTYGFATHVRHCRRQTDEQRKLGQERRAKYRGIPTTRAEMAILNGDEKRLRLCISVGLEQIKLLLPFIEIDKVEIA